MPELELPNARSLAPVTWGHDYPFTCLNEGCNFGILALGIEDGGIYQCPRCETKHEFYDAFMSGPGGRIRYTRVRALIGKDMRAAGEPDVLEFVEK